MGRPRDDQLDARILRAAADLLNESGVQGLTFEAVAARAGTSRPAIYRRFDSLTDLTVTALGTIAPSAGGERTGDHLADLTAELDAFRAAIIRLGSINVAASVLLDTTDLSISATYRRTVVQPRRRRLRQILEDAAQAGLLDADPQDLAVAVTMCTGSWYAHALAGTEPPDDWPERTATLVWRALATNHPPG